MVFRRSSGKRMLLVPSGSDRMELSEYIIRGIESMTNEEIMSVVKPAVCAQLKSPASAQFPDDRITIVGDEQTGYRVNGFVDSQNSYGAMIRNDFAATVTISNGRPVVTSSSVGTLTAKANAKSFGKNYIAMLILTALGGGLLYLIISLIVK